MVCSQSLPNFNLFICFSRRRCESTRNRLGRVGQIPQKALSASWHLKKLNLFAQCLTFSIQFQTQSLIDLNVQLVKKSEQCVDNLKQNDNSTTKSIRNPLFKLNNYQTIDEDSYSKLKQFYSSSSNFFHNDEAMSEVTIHTSSNSKPVQKNIKLRKGQMLK